MAFLLAPLCWLSYVTALTPGSSSKKDKLAPTQVLGTFHNGRVESWLHMRPLTPEQMCELKTAACISRRLADFHAAEIEGLSKEPQVFKLILKW